MLTSHYAATDLHDPGHLLLVLLLFAGGVAGGVAHAHAIRWCEIVFKRIAC